jgi:hypothetical protein
MKTALRKKAILLRRVRNSYERINKVERDFAGKFEKVVMFWRHKRHQNLLQYGWGLDNQLTQI